LANPQPKGCGTQSQPKGEPDESKGFGGFSSADQAHNIQHPAAEGGKGSTKTNPNQKLTTSRRSQASEVAEQCSTHHIHQHMVIGPMESDLPTQQRSRDSAKGHQEQLLQFCFCS
jgi:hypothetical protein